MGIRGRTLMFMWTVVALISCSALALDIDVLMDVKLQLNNPEELRGWQLKRAAFMCAGEWKGVTCHSNTSFVRQLLLHDVTQAAGGRIAPAIGSLAFLQYLDLSSNRLTGPIPSELGNLTNLLALDLSNNLLSDRIPPQLLNLTALQNLTLTTNQLSGPIPPDISRMSSLQRLRIGRNSISGAIPYQIISLQQLRYLEIEYNTIDGEIPLQFGNMSRLRRIFAAGNRLSGPLPETLASIRMQRLDLSANNLSGLIPASWNALADGLLSLNLSDNQLVGPVPSALWAKFNASFAGNAGLCGNTFLPSCSPPASPSSMSPSWLAMPPAFHYPDQPPLITRQKGGNTGNTIAYGVVGGTVGLSALIVVAVLVIRKRSSSAIVRDANSLGHGVARQPAVQNWFSAETQAKRTGGTFRCYSPSISSYTYEEIVYHAGHFDTAHVIGKGRFSAIFRSHLPDGHTQLAIKVFKYASSISASFENEMETLAAIKHPNLLPIIGYYSDAVEKAIIYDHVPGGTLHDLLHVRPTIAASESPDWRTRQRLAYGVSQALLYLHKGVSASPVIHEDVKSSNILLQAGHDNELVARVADYGLLHLLSSGPHIEGHAGLIASGGYTDPVVLLTKKYTEKSDVYSFGVVLLELLTGKSAVWREVDGTVMDLGRWVEGLHREGFGREAIHPLVLESCPFGEYVDRALNLAMLCVAEKAAMRPSMAEVVSVLEGLASNPSPLRSPEHLSPTQKPLLLPPHLDSSTTSPPAEFFSERQLM